MEYIYYILCKEFGWTYQDLETQPRAFIDSMVDVLGVVKKYERKRS